MNKVESFLITHVGGNIVDGANWGFCPIEDYERLASTMDLNQEQNVKFFPLKANTGVLIQVNSNFLLNTLNQLPDVTFEQEDITYMVDQNKIALLQFRGWLERNGEYQGFIGINETTDATTVTISQVTYPSFKVDVETVLHEFDKYELQYLTESNQWVRFDRGVSKEDFIKACTVSPTRNCMVLPVKIQGVFEL
ncbi:hypothetical protein [Bacillus toyonensis]|uniref:hypothetical protein n=1 Tax=Bacillus toyonensis TaxID=155322 RepID=UPI0020D26BC3|nr:hypothetical protein [Bacillus toyonensis]